jgi:hypothetical protein
MRHLGKALLVLGFCILGCGKSSPQPDVLMHFVPVPSTNRYTVTGRMMIRAGGAKAGLIQYSTDDANFQDVPYISRTFGGSEAWYELEVSNTQFWIRVLGDGSTNEGTVALIMTRE